MNNREQKGIPINDSMFINEARINYVINFSYYVGSGIAQYCDPAIGGHGQKIGIHMACWP